MKLDGDDEVGDGDASQDEAKHADDDFEDAAPAQARQRSGEASTANSRTIEIREPRADRSRESIEFFPS